MIILIKQSKRMKIKQNNYKENSTNIISSMTPLFNNNNEKINEDPKENILSSYGKEV